MVRMTSYELVRSGTTGDGCWLWERGVDSSGYGVVKRSGRSLALHRLSYELHVGPIPDGTVIHHTCFQRSCWNPEHLTPVTSKANLQARVNTAKNNTSGWRGVYPSGLKWRAMVKSNGKVIHLGTHNCPTKAGLTALSKRRELGFFE